MTSGSWKRQLSLKEYSSCYSDQWCRENAWDYQVNCDVVHFDRNKFKTCAESANIHLSGDSRIRQSYYVLQAILNNDNNTVFDPKDTLSKEFTINNNLTKVLFYWRPRIEDHRLHFSQWLPMLEHLPRNHEVDLNPNKPNYFMFGSNWLWQIRYFEHNIAAENSSQEFHDEFAKNYTRDFKVLKPLIESAIERFPDSKFLTDAPAWRMAGEHVMFRNYASDLHDIFMEPFWNDAGMQHFGFYSSGKKNSFSKDFSVTKRTQTVYKKGLKEEFKFDLTFAKPDSLPGGLHYRV